MVECWINIVRPDGIDAELLHQSGIPQAQSPVAQGVGRVCCAICALSARLIIDANQCEAVVGDAVKEL